MAAVGLRIIDGIECMKQPALIIAAYSPEWPREFDRERAALAAALAPLPVHIEHIGSTSVPGMSAKPIIDIMLGAPSLEEVEARMATIEQLGYEHLPEMRELMPDNRFFAKPATLPRRFHLHAVEYDGEFWRDHIAFRDMLREDSQLAAQYVALKSRLAREFKLQPKRYTDAKGPFINAAVQRGQRK
jgi:GrpB-like predicted nucleotidyltransferase (UPF0157 family)